MRAGIVMACTIRNNACGDEKQVLSESYEPNLDPLGVSFREIDYQCPLPIGRSMTQILAGFDTEPA